MYRYKVLSKEPWIVGITHHKNNNYCLVKCFGGDAEQMAKDICRLFNQQELDSFFLRVEQSVDVLTSSELDAT